jgi:hypothetical protein
MANPTHTSAHDSPTCVHMKKLGTPLHLETLATPTSKSSLKYLSPAAPSPFSLDTLSQLAANLGLSPPVHTKKPCDMTSLRPGEETPQHNGNGFMTGIQRAFASSKKLQRVLGLEDSVMPFVPPPPMPDDILEAFKEGLKEFGQDAATVGVDGLQTIYEEPPIGREEYSLAHMGYETLGSDDGNPVQVYGIRSPSMGKLLGSLESLTAEESVGQDYMDVDAEWPPYENIQHADYGLQTYPTEPRQRSNNRVPWLRPHSRISRRPTVQDTYNISPTATRKDINYGADEQTMPPTVSITEPDPPYTHSYMGTLPVFPSPFWGPSAVIAPSMILHRSEGGLFSHLFERPQNPIISSQDVPSIFVTSATSPTKQLHVPRKRARASPDLSAEHMSPNIPSTPSQSNPARKKRRSDTVPTGIRCLPPGASYAWEAPFPGNTPGLSYRLMTWHCTMRDIYTTTTLNQPQLSIHPLFPYPPTPPKHIPLVSASFWDTDCEPHRELWFIGPGDVEVLNYNEVDTFAELQEKKAEVGKRERGVWHELAARNKWEGKKNQGEYAKAMKDRALTGEGRWGFFVIRGRASMAQRQRQGQDYASMRGEEEEEQDYPPYIILAFPISAITTTSECIHILYPDNPEPDPAFSPSNGFRPPPPSAYLQPHQGSKLPRMTSMPAIRQTNLSFQLRSASNGNLSNPTSPSNPSLPPSSFSEFASQKGRPWPLRRTTFLFDKAGHVPLIEGYRTDLQAWRPFLEAFGRGEVKIVVFGETGV